MIRGQHFCTFCRGVVIGLPGHDSFLPSYCQPNRDAAEGFAHRSCLESLGLLERWHHLLVDGHRQARSLKLFETELLSIYQTRAGEKLVLKDASSFSTTGGTVTAHVDGMALHLHSNADNICLESRPKLMIRFRAMISGTKSVPLRELADVLELHNTYDSGALMAGKVSFNKDTRRALPRQCATFKLYSVVVLKVPNRALLLPM